MVASFGEAWPGLRRPQGDHLLRLRSGPGASVLNNRREAASFPVLTDAVLKRGRRTRSGSDTLRVRTDSRHKRSDALPHVDHAAAEARVFRPVPGAALPKGGEAPGIRRGVLEVVFAIAVVGS